MKTKVVINNNNILIQGDNVWGVDAWHNLPV
jgi:hypothetical protein